MILKRYLLSEIVKNFITVFLVIFTILLSTQLLRVLSSVTQGKISSEMLFLLLSLRNIESMVLVIPLAFYLAIVLAISRMYKDNEMGAIYSCGIEPNIIFKSLLPMLFVLLTLETILVFYIAPWSNGYVDKIKHAAIHQADVHLIEPSRFTIFANATTTVYAEKIEQDKYLSNVFIHIKQGEIQRSIIAQKAELTKKNGLQYVVLEKGKRYEGIAGDDNYQIMTFEQYGILLQPQQNSDQETWIYAKSFDELWQAKQNPANQAEIQWRISMIISIVVLALLAIPLSKTSPRKGRFAKAFPAIFIYFFYYSFLNASKNWIKRNDFPYWIGMWWVHILIVMMFMLLYAYQNGWLYRKKTI